MPTPTRTRFTSNEKDNLQTHQNPAPVILGNLSKNESIYGRQIAFAAAFLLPMSKLLEAPALLSKYAAGDLLLPALLHFLLQGILLGVLLFVVFRSETPLITRLKKGLGKFMPIFYLLYALYFIFSAVLPLFDLEKYVYAAFFDTEPTVFSFGFFFILSAFICTKGIKAIGRCADVCLFLFPLSFLALIAMSLSSTDFTRLLPLFGSKFEHTMYAFTRTTPHFSDIILLLPLLCQYQPKKEDKKKILFGYGFGALCTLVFLAVFYCTYASLAPREHYAFSKIAQYFPALSILGRIDLIFVYLLSVVLLFYTCLPLQYAVELFSQATNTQDYRVWISFLLNLALFFFLLYGNKYYNTFYQTISGKLSVIFWLIADMVPLFLLFLPKFNENNNENNNEKSNPKQHVKKERSNA